MTGADDVRVMIKSSSFDMNWRIDTVNANAQCIEPTVRIVIIMWKIMIIISAAYC